VAIENQSVNDEIVVFSISSPYVVHPVIHGKYVYQFHFHDVKEEYLLRDILIAPMEYRIAEQIAQIAISHRDKTTWIIHCEAGISRSPGVALGLSRYIDFDPDISTLQKRFPCHNSHVRTFVEKALREGLRRMDEL
jgi:predicted protein tyrosine phosphatase